jgi:hypothetical protein
MVECARVIDTQAQYQNLAVWNDGASPAVGDASIAPTSKGFAPALPTMARPSPAFQSQADGDRVSSKPTAAKTALGGLLKRWGQQAVARATLDFSQVSDREALPRGWSFEGRVERGLLRAGDKFVWPKVTRDHAQAKNIELTFCFDLASNNTVSINGTVGTAVDDNHLGIFNLRIRTGSGPSIFVAGQVYVYPGMDGRARIYLDRTPQGGWLCNGKEITPRSEPLVWTNTVLVLGPPRGDFPDNLGIESVAIE